MNSSALNPVYAGSSLTLTCTVLFTSAIDVQYSVNIAVTRSGNQLNNNYTTVSPVVSFNAFTYQTTVEIDVVTQTHTSGVYTCTAVVMPNSPSPFVLSSTNSDSITITVEGLCI